MARDIDCARLVQIADQYDRRADELLDETNLGDGPAESEA
ncbi:MAG: hypothetical protein QOG84_150 [Sphingomonadales bacterium]|jgi:hypothetical protein|nr:hypothetical protein [Sphingomonadales bacterium]